jgi:hypothetical protein
LIKEAETDPEELILLRLAALDGSIDLIHLRIPHLRP